MGKLQGIVGVVIICMASFGVSSCGPGDPEFQYLTKNLTQPDPQSLPEYPDVKFAQISDIHVFDPSLGTTGAAWEEYMANDRKLLGKSTEILESALVEIRASGPQFLVVSGDLTKDGERLSHEWVAKIMAGVEASGVQVYVIPGNHDVLNPHSFAYRGNEKVKVDHVTPEDFSQIYQDFGYTQALKRDPASLSYLAEPVSGLWLLALDTAMYETNFTDDYPKTEGLLRQQTLSWAESILQEAQVQHKAVIITQHHGLVEHWPGQARFHPEYLVEHRGALARAFARYGVRLVLTGHYHSQDNALQRFPEDGTWIADLESGSLVTWPSPWKLLEIQNNQLSVETAEVKSIASLPEGFPLYSRNFVKEGLKSLTKKTAGKFFVSPEDQERIAELSSEAFLNHYAGDEAKAPGYDPLESEGMGFMGKIMMSQLGYVLDGLWKDSQLADRNISLDLTTGSWVKD